MKREWGKEKARQQQGIRPEPGVEVSPARAVVTS
jgi:hypothetical protein